MRLSPRTLIGLGVVLTLVTSLLVIWQALATPRLGLTLGLDSNGGIVVRAVENGGPNSSRVKTGDVLTAFGPDMALVARAELLIEEPDTLPSFADYNAFLHDQNTLAEALHTGTLVVQVNNAGTVALATRPARLGDLPFLFWFQLFVGAGGVLTGVLVWALGPSGSIATRLYALTGLGYLVFAPAAAIYSTRELALEGGMFRLLSVTNHFGALFFTASLSALLWVYPRRLGGLWMPLLCYSAAFAVWLLDMTQQGGPETFHFGVLIVFALSFVFAAMQWWQTRRAPADRAALRWFLLSIYLATGLFAGVIIIPAALNLPMPAPQGVMFGAFLIMYWGLALGVVRYRLFQLESWWYAVWAWFLGGLAVVLVDVLLLSLLTVPQGMALSLSVAIVGWLYFPVRQRLWELLGGGRNRTLQQWLPDVLPLLIQTNTGEATEARLRERWPAILQAVYRPLQIAPDTSPSNSSDAGNSISDNADANSSATGSDACVTENGLALLVPDMRRPGQRLCLRHAADGERLFTRQDLLTLESLQHLFALSLDLFRARDAGAQVERERIARDIHDDLGAKLLTLLHKSPEELQPLVREAIRDTRSLLHMLNFRDIVLGEAVTKWRDEIRERCDAHQTELDWDNRLDRELGLILSSRQHANLTRVLREAVSNALRHSGASRLGVHVGREGDRLHLRVHDNGAGANPAAWQDSGRGMAIMRARLAELEGQVEWQADGNGCTVSLHIPLGTALAIG
ncbi:MAG: ATP-binding protein [Moraxellaceae bacterium]|nr:ATP-binding protein [Moraxellaceae bacterium]